jgi:hypothetical protein
LRVELLFLLLLSGPAHSAPPPLAPNEELVKSVDGCGFVIRGDDPMAEYARQGFAELTWPGACVDGLAMGEGLISQRTKLTDGKVMEPSGAWFWYGRMFGITVQSWSNGAATTNFTWDGQTVSYNTLDATKAVWSNDWTLSSKVITVDTMVAATASPRYQVNVLNRNTKALQSFPCPNMSSSENCESVWTEHARPVIQRVTAFLAENEGKARARQAEVKPLVSKWKAKVGSKEVALREATAWDKNKATTEKREESWKQKLDAQQACYAAERAAEKVHTDSDRREHDAVRGHRLGLALKQIAANECREQSDAARLVKRADDLIESSAPKLAEIAQIPELMQRADQYFNAGNYEKARQTYSEIRSIDVTNIRAHLGGGATELRLGNFLGAKLAADSIWFYDPSNAAALELVRAAESGERHRDIAYQQKEQARRQEDWNFLANAVQTFVDTKVQVEQQEQAAAQARVQAQADAQAQREASARSKQATPMPSAQAGSQQPAPLQTAASTPSQAGSTSADYRAQQQREVDQSNLDNKRRAEDLAARNAHASNCVEPVQQPGAFGAFRNKCGYAVNYVFCTLGSTGQGLTNFSDAFDCRKSGAFGQDGIAPHGVQGSSIAGAPQVLWGACKHPFYPSKARYNGREIIFGCEK